MEPDNYTTLLKTDTEKLKQLENYLSLADYNYILELIKSDKHPIRIMGKFETAIQNDNLFVVMPRISANENDEFSFSVVRLRRNYLKLIKETI